MTTATEIEDAILEQIAPLRAHGLTVNALPDTSAAFSQVMATAEEGLITLVFKDDGEYQGACVQQQTITRSGKLYLRLRHMDGPAGADQVKLTIRNALMGYAPPRCTRLALGAWESQGRTEDLYLFTCDLRCFEIYQVQ